MTTPLIIAALLASPMLAVPFWATLTGRPRPTTAAAAGIGLALVFAFTGMGHFVKTQGMIEMIPPWVPARGFAVFVSGLFEWGLAAALIVSASRPIAARYAIAFLALVLPVNVWAAVNGVGLGGHQWGPVYLWIRVPLQILLVGWAILAARRTDR